PVGVATVGALAADLRRRERIEGARPGEAFQAVAVDARTRGEICAAGVGTGTFALVDERLHLLLADPLHVAEADADVEVGRFHVADDAAAVDVWRQHGEA